MPKKKNRGKSSKGIAHWLSSSKHNKYTVLVIAAAVVIGVDLGLLANTLVNDHDRQIFIKKQTSELGSNNVPSSKKPTAAEVASYTVAPTLPKYLVIPTLDIYSRVTKIYTTSQDQIQAPSNIYDTGWYVGSSLPGQPGAMFIDGHVSSWTADGVFFNLKDMKPGQTIKIIRGDNKTFTYVVDKVQSYATSNVNMSQVLSPIKPGTAALNLMTCTGSVISGTSEFNQRLVVYSTLQT